MKRRPSAKTPVRLEKTVLCIIDANLNRAKEGLRTCEDIVRFALKRDALLRPVAALRHEVESAFARGRLERGVLLAARDVAGDPGKAYRLGPARKRIADVFFANGQRVKESLRVLEEMTKIYDTAASARLQRVRFRFYDWEKEAARRLKALPRPR
jgi:thiamine-phosphate pyrophosphorylase